MVHSTQPEATDLLSGARNHLDTLRTEIARFLHPQARRNRFARGHSEYSTNDELPYRPLSCVARASSPPSQQRAD